MPQHLSGAIHAVGRKVQVIDKKDNAAAANGCGNRRWLRGGKPKLSASSQLFFSGTARSHALKKGDRPRLTVNHQLKLFSVESVNKASIFIRDRDSSLDEFSVDADHVVCLFLRLLRDRRRSIQQRRHAKHQ